MVTLFLPKYKICFAQVKKEEREQDKAGSTTTRGYMHRPETKEKVVPARILNSLLGGLYELL